LEIGAGGVRAGENDQRPSAPQRFSHKRLSPRQPDESGRRKSGAGFREKARDSKKPEAFGDWLESPKAREG
jgi:hypothetical protein